MTEVCEHEHLRREERKRIGCVAILLLCVLIGLSFLFYVGDYGWASPDCLAYPSPDGKRAAYLISTNRLGMADPLELFVSPTGSMKDMLWVGTVCFDDDLALTDLIWTTDSDFVAAKCSKRLQNYSTNTSTTYTVYYCGYRFSSKTVFTVGDDYDKPDVLEARDKEITHILSEKSGRVVVAKGRREPVDPTVKARPVGWLQLRKCRNLIEVGREVQREELPR